MVDVDLVVAGAGITGLVAAYRAVRQGMSVVLAEASDRAGGVIRTSAIDGFTIERGPNTVRMTDELEALVDELGIAGEVVFGDPRAPRWLFVNGRLEIAPMGPASAITTRLLSKRAKLRLLGEPFVGRPRDKGEQSIEGFVTRRLGREVHDVLVSSFVAGVYAGDTSRLSAEAVFPGLVAMERDHGGLVRGAIAAIRHRRANPSTTAPKRRRPLTIMSFESGLTRLPDALADALGETLRLNAPVTTLERTAGGFTVMVGGSTVVARNVLVAAPAYAAAGVVRPVSADLANGLAAIEYARLASVSVAYEHKDIAHDCKGFGFLAPRDSGLGVLGAVFPSSLFAGRAPDGWQSFTCFIGGATDPGAIDRSDDELVSAVADALERTVGARGAPKILSLERWTHAIPQYTVGHPARVADIERAAAAAGIELAGNALHGVSVGDCIRDAYRAIGEIVERSRH